MKIELLLHHKHLIPEIAKLKFEQFGYLVPEKKISDFQKGLEEHLSEKEFPITFVAIENSVFIGTFSLREYDMKTHQHLSPWIGSVLIAPNKRNQGIGSLLVKKAESIAKKEGYDRLYLFTPDKAAWYVKLGWKIMEYTTFNNIPVTIMVTEL